MPIQSAGQPATEPAPVRKFAILKRIEVVGTAALTKPRVRGVNLQPTGDHAGEQHEGGPVRKTDDPMMTFYSNGNRRNGRSGGSGGSRHATSIFSAMRLATLVIIGILSSCRRAPRDAYVPNRSDSAAFSDMAAHDSADNALLTPRVVTGPTVIVFWLPAADTLSADDQAEALDDLNNATDHIAPTLKRHNVTLLPTNAETSYVALPNRQRRTILLSGIDYPFGYVLLEPGTAERILAGVYNDDELQDEVEAYFDLPSSGDSTTTGPRIS